MNINSLEFSYPVLSSYNDDYVDSFFDVDYKLIDRGFESKSLVAKFRLDDEIIEKYLDEDVFIILLHLECSITSFRKVYKVDKKTRKITIPIDTSTMRSKVEISSFIVANKDLDIYKNKNINEKIYGENYTIKNLKKGDIIAAVYSQNMNIEVDQDDFQNFPSVIKVGQSKENFLEVNLDDDVIVIHLPEKEYIQYIKLSNTIYSDIIMTTIILPSLVYILDQLSDSNNIPIYSDLTWFKVIESKLALKNIDVEDINESYSSIRLAQMILESPIERSLSSIEQEIEGADY